MWDNRSLRYRDDRIEAPGGGSPLGQTHIILFIHGYNNDRDDAEDSYGAMTRNLPGKDRALTQRIWKFYWPSFVERLRGTLSDQPTSLSSRYRTAGSESNALLSIPSYPWQVLKAPEVGRALGRYFRTLYAGAVPTRITIVAHSLGCRVALEALREMLAGSSEEAERLRLACVCLMAAAVPTFMVEKSERLGSAAALPERTVVMHSTADGVLRWTFPSGQSTAQALRRLGYGTVDEAPPGAWRGPEAVGRAGNPTHVFLRRTHTGLGHSKYWSSANVARGIVEAMGKADLPDHHLPETSGLTWTLPTYPDLPDWKNRGQVGTQMRSTGPLG